MASIIDTHQLKATVLGAPTALVSEFSKRTVSRVLSGYCAESFNRNSPLVAPAFKDSSKKEDHIKGAAREKAAFELSIKPRTMKNEAHTCHAGDLTTALIEAAGDSSKALAALETHLPSMIKDLDGGEALATHILGNVVSCFVSGDAAQPILLRWIDEYLFLRGSTTSVDPLAETKRLETSNLQALKASIIEAQQKDAALTAAAAAAETPAKKEAAAKNETPTSLDESATPAERKIYRSVKKIGHDLRAGFDQCEARDTTLFAQGRDGWAKLEEERIQREQKEMDAAESAQKAKEEQEDAERKAKREAERKALQDKRDATAKREEDRAFLTASLKEHEVSNRAFQKTIAYSEGDQTRAQFHEELKAKDADLDDAYKQGQQAEANALAEANAQAAARKKPVIASGIAAKVKVFQESADENAGMQQPALLCSSAGSSSAPAPVLSTPRRSARGLAKNDTRGK